jgi:predicted nucleotide-binding protein
MAKNDTLKSKSTNDTTTVKGTKRKTRVAQADIPRYTVQEALRIAEALVDNYAKAPTKPLHLAAAIDMSVNSGPFRMLLGASSAYGLTTGAYDSGVISLTPLGKQVVDAKSDEDKRTALKEAFIKPRVVGAFLNKYADARIPKDNIARQVLEEMGVPADSAEQALKLIVRGASELGLLRNMKGSQYIDLDGVPALAETSSSIDENDGSDGRDDYQIAPNVAAVNDILLTKTSPVTSNNRVFITHGKNLDIVNQLKELLTFGNFAPVVAAEHETISKPVPDKVMDDMRSCSAAIIHVGKEINLLDQEGNEHIFINQNVLIEIGAAMALYGRKFILLVESGAKLPSNLQGLYEVRYSGNKLDYEATMKLLKAFNDFRQ